ncbi:tetratricopeptide repeat protein [Flexibacterium corallicola]|uniref:tetratricopeptide repeat protein n=1 Tax=Flexibacterium corallicola TaxID=3037259 RepID=UPI00286ECE26|nr:tetratricopeptide repeat protein [Pseudovibrio sp. M1P-2-3]
MLTRSLTLGRRSIVYGTFASILLALPSHAESLQKLNTSELLASMRGIDQLLPEDQKGLLAPAIITRPTEPQGKMTTQDSSPTQGDLAYGAFQRGWYLTALDRATKAVEAGQTKSATLIGVLYETGRGVPQDLKTAAHWYELATKNDDPQAALRLGLLYLSGSGVAQDKKKAADYLGVAAKAQLNEALFNLALLYQEGEVFPQSTAKAKELYEQASLSDDVDAMYALGLLLLDSEQGQYDEMRGAYWLGRAARRGNIEAQVQYAVLLFHGKGVVPNQNEAADWFERAANAGNPIAMNRLARMYAFGAGRPKNIIEASAWQSLASRMGIFDSELDELTKRISLNEQEKVSMRVQELEPLLRSH